jgi:hypothetical protein
MDLKKLFCATCASVYLKPMEKSIKFEPTTARFRTERRSCSQRPDAEGVYAAAKIEATVSASVFLGKRSPM